MKSINPLGFLGLVGFVGLLGFTQSDAAFPYLAYGAYFYYFTQPFTPELRDIALKALGLAYLVSFVTNMIFISISFFGGTIDYQSGFYVSYSAGSFAFPITFTLLKIRSTIIKSRSGNQDSATAPD